LDYLGFLAIALELCVNGSLKDELKKLRNGDYKIILDECVEVEMKQTVKIKLAELFPKLFKWCKEIASGMEHLENLSVKNLHSSCIFLAQR